MSSVESKIDVKKWAMVAGGTACTLGLGYMLYQQVFGQPPQHNCLSSKSKDVDLDRQKYGCDEALAISRKLQIEKSVSYSLFLQFTESTETFFGKVKIVFNTADLESSNVPNLKDQKVFDSDVYLDYAGKICSITINEEFLLPEEYLNSGLNRNKHLLR